MYLQRLIASLTFGVSMMLTAQAATILAGHPLTVGVGEALLQGSNHDLQLAAPRNLPATRQLNYWEQRGKEALAEASRKADAVLTVRSIFAQDYLYPLARRHNIRLIPMDIATPIDGASAGVALLDLPVAQHPVWLNPSSLSAIFTLTARELSALDGSQTAVIEENLAREHKRLVQLSETMETFLAEHEQPPVFLLLQPELTYLAQGLQAEALSASLPAKDDEHAWAALKNLIAEQGVNVALSGSELDAEQSALLAEWGVRTVLVPRLRAEHPTTQLEAIYHAIRVGLERP